MTVAFINLASIDATLFIFVY